MPKPSIVTVIFLLLSISNAHALELFSNLLYLNSTSTNGPIITCGNTTWDSNNTVAIYLGSELIFDSTIDYNDVSTLSLGPQDEYILKTVDDRYVYLVNRNTSWNDLYCMDSKNDSSNHLTIPYIGQATLLPVPEEFHLNETVTLTCQGVVSSDTLKHRIDFKYNQDLIVATIENDRLVPGTVPGIELVPEKTSNNSISFNGTLPFNYGQYSCSYVLFLENNSTVQTDSWNSWNTAGISCNESIITTEYPYFGEDFPFFMVSCNKTLFDNDTNVKFFNGQWLLFDSADPERYSSQALPTGDNRSVVIQTRDNQQYRSLSCSINNTANENTIAVSRVHGPNLEYSPTVFQLGTTYKLTCSGWVESDTNVSVSFAYDGVSFADLIDSNLIILEDKPTGLKVVHLDQSNNSVTVVPTLVSNEGTYSCLFTFSDELVVQSRTAWVAKPTSSASSPLVASSLVILLISLTRLV